MWDSLPACLDATWPRFECPQNPRPRGVFGFVYLGGIWRAGFVVVMCVWSLGTGIEASFRATLSSLLRCTLAWSAVREESVVDANLVARYVPADFALPTALVLPSPHSATMLASALSAEPGTTMTHEPLRSHGNAYTRCGMG